MATNHYDEFRAVDVARSIKKLYDSEDFDINNTNSLGLTIVKSLTLQLDGKIEVKGERGTSITITFPG